MNANMRCTEMTGDELRAWNEGGWRLAATGILQDRQDAIAFDRYGQETRGFLISERARLESLTAGLLRSEMEAQRIPAYVLFASEIPSLGETDAIIGWTAPNLSAIYQKEIGSRWRGHGVAFVLNDGYLIRGALALGATVDDLRLLLTAHAVHEIGHIAEFGARPSTMVPGGNVEAVKETVAGWASQPEAPADSIELAMNRHGPAFLRAMLHAAYRCGASFGLPLVEAALCATDEFGLSPMDQYREALRGEFQALAHVPLSELRAHPAPVDFRILWLEDLQWMRANYVSPTAESEPEDVGGEEVGEHSEELEAVEAA